jgi:hypothetical protein
MPKVTFEFDMDKPSDVEHYKHTRIAVVYKDALVEVLTYLEALKMTAENVSEWQALQKLKPLINEFVTDEELGYEPRKEP